MWGGHTGPGQKTIVPREAHAKVSFRLVAHQDPAEVLTALQEHLAAHTPAGIEAVITPEGPRARPATAPTDSPAALAGPRAPARPAPAGAPAPPDGGQPPGARP